MLEREITKIMMRTQNDRALDEENKEILVDWDNDPSPSQQAGVPEDVDLSCLSEQIHVGSGNNKKVLYMHCIGLRFNDEPLSLYEEEPWSTLPKTVLRPQNKQDFVNEILRRANDVNVNLPPSKAPKLE